MAGKVYIVGAGPGDPELLTLKALRALEQADVILHDGLVPPEVLKLAPASAAVFSVGKRCGRKSVSQEEINSLMITYASAGFHVVRLHGGDPLIFGRAGEEIRALRETGVDFEIVPGVTAPLAAAAAARIALTERHVASSVIFLSAHHARKHDGADAWPGWPSSIAPDSTVVVYMPGDDYAMLAARLEVAGVDPETPCLLVASASMAQEQILVATLAELAEAPRLPSPKILIAGAAVASADRAEIRQLAEAAIAAGVDTE